MTSSVRSLNRPAGPSSGPLLEAVIRAQDTAATSLASDQIERHARSLVELALSLDGPLLLAVSPMAHRLVGAALVIGGGRVNAYDDRRCPAPDQPVLLVEAAAVHATGLRWHRDLLARLGVSVVHATAIELLDRGQDDDVFVLSSWRRRELRAAR
jgi:hypothetical protein